MNIVRLYNQNRRKIWRAIIIVASIIVIIQLLNIWSKKKIEMESNISNTTIYSEKGFNNNNLENVNMTSVINDKKLTQEEVNEDINIINNFVDYCNSGDILSAYDLISDECKKICYQSEEIFKKGYYDDIFTNRKKCKISAWDIDSTVNIYKIIFEEDLLSTGNVNKLNNEDYFNIVEVNGGEKKINIGGFICRKNIDSNKIVDNVIFKVNYVDIFKEYSIYNISVKNGSSETVIIDDESKNNSLYITDSKNINAYALSNELIKNDLIVDSNKTNKLNIRFNNTFTSKRNFKFLTFSNCVIEGEKQIINIQI